MVEMKMIYIALENVRSLYNVGSVMRTMSFFGLNNLLLIGYSGRKKPGLNELHGQVNKTSLGAEKDIKVVFFCVLVKIFNTCFVNIS